MRVLRLLPVLALLAACEAPQQRLGAAEDVRAFLLAARESDRAAFDRHIDRTALKAQLREELSEQLVALPPGIPVAARAGLLDQLVDNLGPETFQFATQGIGPLAGRTPSVAEIAAVLRPQGETKVCLPRSQGSEACAATFEKQGDTWRLVAVDVSGLRVGKTLPLQFQEQFPEHGGG